MVILEYLYDFGLPWLGARQGIRGNCHVPIDMLWKISLPWFRSTGKTLYSVMAVDVIFMMALLSAPLLLLYNKCRTISMRGNAGKNVAYDLGCETMNNEIKTGLGKSVTRMNIDPYILMTLGLRWIQQRLFSVLGLTRDDSTDIRQTPEDIQAIVQGLREKLGTTPAELFAKRSSNPFKRGNGVPSSQVNEGRDDLAEYVREHLESSPADLELKFCQQANKCKCLWCKDRTNSPT